jgi:hypothetical protein
VIRHADGLYIFGLDRNARGYTYEGRWMMDDIVTKGFRVQGSLEECRSNDDRGGFASDGEQTATAAHSLNRLKALKGMLFLLILDVCC